MRYGMHLTSGSTAYGRQAGKLHTEAGTAYKHTHSTGHRGAAGMVLGVTMSLLSQASVLI